jgi:hypothetical protein
MKNLLADLGKLRVAQNKLFYAGLLTGLENCEQPPCSLGSRINPHRLYSA